MHRFKGAAARNCYAVVWSKPYQQFIRIGYKGGQWWTRPV